MKKVKLFKIRIPPCVGGCMGCATKGKCVVPRDRWDEFALEWPTSAVPLHFWGPRDDFSGYTRVRTAVVLREIVINAVEKILKPFRKIGIIRYLFWKATRGRCL